MVAWSGESLEVQNQVCKVFKFGLLVSDSVRMEQVIDGWMEKEDMEESVGDWFWRHDSLYSHLPQSDCGC